MIRLSQGRIVYGKIIVVDTSHLHSPLQVRGEKLTTNVTETASITTVPADRPFETNHSRHLCLPNNSILSEIFIYLYKSQTVSKVLGAS